MSDNEFEIEGWKSSFTADNCTSLHSSDDDNEPQPYDDNQSLESNFSEEEEEEEDIETEVVPQKKIKKQIKYTQILQEESDFDPE